MNEQTVEIYLKDFHIISAKKNSNKIGYPILSADLA